MVKPGDGIRLTYLPKDLSDFQYYPITKSSLAVKARNAGGRPESEKEEFDGEKSDINTQDASNWVGPATNWPVYGGKKCTITYQTDGDAVVVYWKGMQVPSSADLRIDVVRKFNGFPLAKYRDILDLTKPKKLFDPKKTIDVVQEL